MKKIAVVYWSGTGNTELMAGEIAKGAKAAGAEADVIPAADFNAGRVSGYDRLAFGCPSMGAEELEDSEFEPMFASAEKELSGKEIALFGSYGWGDGQWMRDWQARCENAGARLLKDGLIVNGEPGAAELTACRDLGGLLAE